MTSFSKVESKVFDWETLKSKVSGWKASGQNVVFTNGCFDILHYGHIHYLSEARDLGDKLVVALNSPASIQRLKGPTRPLHDAISRVHIMASLEFVDAVVVFEEDTPLALIQHVLPSTLVKGGDYAIEEIVGHKEVIADGGSVQTLDFVAGYSTTNLEEKIKNS